jgi:ppGpp synthetase/RelA/SpoT-type nucleotidyltranferase
MLRGTTNDIAPSNLAEGIADLDNVARVEPEYDRETINRAGVVLRDAERIQYALQPEDEPRYLEAIEVINNWRSSHAYPLNAIQTTLRDTCKRQVGRYLIAQRIKRLSSIAHKLDRFEKMRLSQMQDLGGCRAILPVTANVLEVANYYRHVSRQRHEIATVDDYVEKPRESGYRGVHLVFRYHSGIKANEKYNGLKIEMQLRSRYQHAWATAVETVGMFSGQALKSSLGSEEWQHFFALMGSVIAMREKRPLVPGTPTHRGPLLSELAQYADELNVVDRLHGYRNAVKSMLQPTQANASYFLLELDPVQGTLTVTGYRADKISEAAQKYAEAEKKQTSGADSVLVSVESVNNLSRAYPNYFADTRVFLQLMQQALSGHSRGIVVPPIQLELGSATPSGNFGKSQKVTG